MKTKRTFVVFAAFVSFVVSNQGDTVTYFPTSGARSFFT